jgi:hemerythrin-like domain-containing protein
MITTECTPIRLEFPTYACSFAAMHDAMRRDARRLVTALDAAGAPADTHRPDLPALARWFDRFEAVIEHHHHCEDDIVWPGLAALVASRDCGAEGMSFVVTREALLDDHHELDAAMTAVRESLHDAASGIGRQDVARHFEACLDAHLTREEAAVFPLLTNHVSEEEFAVLEHAVVEVTPLAAMTFTVPWIMDDAPTDLQAHVRDGMPTPIRLLNRWLLQPRYRRLVAAATGVQASRTSSRHPPSTTCSPSIRSSSTPRGSSPPSTHH